MQLIKELGTKKTGKKIKAKNGKYYDDSRPFGLFVCPHCNKEVEKPLSEGKKYKSCGCNRKYEKHNLSNHKIYSVYKDMLDRCYNKNNKHYDRYGGRGIKVCDRWKNSMAKFAKDMLPTYKERLSIDRINPDGNYEPDNCRWSTKATQVRNTTRLRKNNTTGYRGVDICRNKYRAKIMVDKKSLTLGSFNSAIAAARAYDQFIKDNNLEHTTNGLIS